MLVGHIKKEIMMNGVTEDIIVDDITFIYMGLSENKVYSQL